MAPKVAKVKSEATNSSPSVRLGPRSDVTSTILLCFNLIQEGERSEALRKLSSQLSLHFDDAVSCILQCLSLVLCVDEKSGVVVSVRDFFCTSLTSLSDDKNIQQLLFTKIMDHLTEEQSDSRKLTRLNACLFINSMLDSLPDDASIDALVFEKLVTTLTQRCYDKFPQVRVQAITGLKRLENTPEVQEVILFLLASDPSAEVRVKCLEIYSLRNEHAELCLDRIQDKETSVRVATLKFLSALTKPLKKLSPAKKAATITKGLMDRDRQVVVAAFQCISAWLKTGTCDILSIAHDWLTAGLYTETEVFLSVMVANASWTYGSEVYKFNGGIPWFGTEFENTNLAKTLQYKGIVPDVLSTLQEDIIAFETYTAALENGQKGVSQPTPITRLCDLMVYRQLLDASKQFALVGYSHSKRLGKFGNETQFDNLFTDCTVFSTSAYDLRLLPDQQKELLLICRHTASLDEYVYSKVQPSMLDCQEAEDTQAANVPLVMLVLRLIGEKASPIITSKDNTSDIPVDVIPSKNQSQVLEESYPAYLDYIQDHVDGYEERIRQTQELTKLDKQAHARFLVLEQAKGKKDFASILTQDPEFQNYVQTHKQLSGKYQRSLNLINWTLVHLLSIAHDASTIIQEPVTAENTTWRIVSEVLHLCLSIDYANVDLHALSIELLVVLGRQCLDATRILYIFSLLLALVTNKTYKMSHTCCMHPHYTHIAAETPVHPRVLHIALAGLSEMLLTHQGLFITPYVHGTASGSFLPEDGQSYDTETPPLLQLRDHILTDTMEILMQYSETIPTVEEYKNLFQTTLRQRQNKSTYVDKSYTKWKFDFVCLFSSCQCTPQVNGIAVDIEKLPCLNILPIFNTLGHGHTLSLQLCGDNMDEYADYLLNSNTTSSCLFLGTSTRRKHGLPQIQKKLPQQQLDMLPVSMVQLSYTPESLLSHTSELCTKTLVQALLFDRLPSTFAEATLQHLLYQHIVTTNTSTKQLLVLFFLVYPKYNPNHKTTTTMSIEDDSIRTILTGITDASFQREVGFGIGVYKDYTTNAHNSLAQLTRTQLEEYNLVAANEQWTLCSGMSMSDHTHMLVECSIRACQLALENNTNATKIIQLYQFIAYLIHSTSSSVVNVHPYAPLTASVTAYMKLLIQMVIFALSLPVSVEKDLILPLLQTTNTLLDTEEYILVPMAPVQEEHILTTQGMGTMSQRVFYGCYLLHKVTQQKPQNKKIHTVLGEIATKASKQYIDQDISWIEKDWTESLITQIKTNIQESLEDSNTTWLDDLNTSLVEPSDEEVEHAVEAKTKALSNTTKKVSKRSTTHHSESESEEIPVQSQRSTRPKMQPTVYTELFSEDEE